MTAALSSPWPADFDFRWVEARASKASPDGMLRIWDVTLGGGTVATLTYDSGLGLWRLLPCPAAIDTYVSQWPGGRYGRCKRVPAWVRREALQALAAMSLDVLLSEETVRRAAREGL